MHPLKLLGLWSKVRSVGHISCTYSRLAHIPVMKKEVIENLNPEDGQVFLDMTFGAGGHTEALILTNPNITVYALDRDPLAHCLAQEMSQKYKNQLFPLLGRFSELPTLLPKEKFKKIDGILIDAGCSSMQMNSTERGFALSTDSLLDMRMDGERFPNMPSAADVINNLDALELAQIFKVYGEEKKAKLLGRAIVEARYMLQSLRTTKELAHLVASVLGSDPQKDKLGRPAHPATRVFQALRIFVNNELNELNRAMELALCYLRPGGHLVTLTFHSLEDRIVKRHFQGTDLDEPVSGSIGQKYRNSGHWNTDEALQPKPWQPIYKHVLTPSPEEVQENPRSRSAKLRVAVKL